MIDEQIASARQAGYSDQEILSFLQTNKPDLAPKITQAIDAKYSPAEILNHIAPPKAGIGGNLVGGTMGAIADVVKTGEKLGFVDKSTSQAADQIAASSYGGKSYGERWHSGEKNLATGAGTALVENAPRLAMGLGAGAAGASLGAAIGAPFAGVGAIPGAAIGGALGAALGAGGADFLQNYGRRLQEREDKNGGEPATAVDKAIAAGTSIPQGALGALQVNKFLPAIKMGERTVGQAAGRLAEATATGAATGFVGDTVEQIGRNVGTKTGSTDIGQSADAAILGAIAGGGIRGAGETAGLARKGLSKLATRGYDHPDEVPNEAARLNQIAEENGFNLTNLKDAAQALKIRNDEIQLERGRNKGPGMAAIQIAVDNGLDPQRATSARLALTEPKPSKDQVSALQEAVKKAVEISGDWAEAQTAVDLARKSNTLTELMNRSKYSETGGEPSVKAGGLSGAVDAIFKKTMSTVLSPPGVGGAGALGGAYYAGYAGLPKMTAMAATAANALPVASGLGAGYAGLRAIDSALNTRSKVARFVEGGYPTGGSMEQMGGGMQTMRERVMAERAAQSAAREQNALETQQSAEAVQRGRENINNEQQAAKSAMALAEAVRKLDEVNGTIREPSYYENIKQLRMPAPEIQQMMNDVKAQTATASEQAAAQNARSQETIAQGKQNKANEKQMAKQARDIASAQSKLDKLRGVEREEGYYEKLVQTRMGVEEMQKLSEQLKNELTAEQAAKRNAKTGANEEPTARKANGTSEEPTTAKRKAQAEPTAERENAPSGKPVEAPAAGGKQKGASAKKQPTGRNKGGKTEAGKKQASATKTEGTSSPPSAKKASGKSKPTYSAPLKTLSDGTKVHANPIHALKYTTNAAADKAAGRSGNKPSKVNNAEAFDSGSIRRNTTKIRAVEAFKELNKDAPKAVLKAADEFTGINTVENFNSWIAEKTRQLPKGWGEKMRKHFDNGIKRSVVERTMD